MNQKPITIVQFKPHDEDRDALKSWQTTGDTIMGGKSNGTFKINEPGNCVFQGEVSLENNGGFSLLRHTFEPIKVIPSQKILLKIKGDGKRYQFRLKAKSTDR